MFLSGVLPLLAGATNNIFVFHKTIMYYRGFLESNKNTGMVKRYASLLISELSIATGFYVF